MMLLLLGTRERKEPCRATAPALTESPLSVDMAQAIAHPRVELVEILPAAVPAEGTL